MSFDPDYVPPLDPDGWPPLSWLEPTWGAEEWPDRLAAHAEWLAEAAGNLTAPVDAETDWHLFAKRLRGSGCDFFSALLDLRGEVLDGCLFDRSRFEGANLNGVSFVSAQLTWCDFSYTEMDESDFSGADLTGSNLTGVEAHGSNFSNANLTHVDLDGPNALAGSTTNGARLPFAPEQAAAEAARRLLDGD